MARKRNVDRLKYLPRNINIDFDLTALQQESLQHIIQSFSDRHVCLLHGVTSSGKDAGLYKTDRAIYKARQTGSLSAARDCTNVADHT